MGAQLPRASEAWRWVLFTTDAGLPSDRVTLITESSDGITWAGTDKGLAWFDRYRWRTVGPDQGLPRADVVAAEPDHRGRILVVVDSTLFRGDTTGFHPLSLAESGRRLQVRRAVALGGDTVLALSTNRLLLCLGERCESAGAVSPLLRGTAGGPWTTRSGRIWASTAAGVVARADGDWVVRLPSAGEPYSIRQPSDANGVGVLVVNVPWPRAGVWEWTGEGALRWNADLPQATAVAADVGPDGTAVVSYGSLELGVRVQGAWRWQSVPAGVGTVLAVRFAANGDLWVGSEGGLLLIRATSRLWEYWQANRGDPRNRVNEVLRARDGAVWLGTEGGVGVLPPRGPERWFRESEGKPLGRITGLAEDESGGIWASSGAAALGAFRWDGRRWRHYGESDGLAAGKIHRIVRDRRGRLWFLAIDAGWPDANPDGTVSEGPGVFVLEGGRIRRWEGGDSLPSRRVYGVAEAPDGALWFATLGGLSRFHDGVWRHWTVAAGLLLPRVFALAVDEGNRVWFTHQVGGLGYLDARGRPAYLTTADGLPSDEVLDLRFAPDGALWTAGTGGLARCVERTCTAFRMHDGLTGLHLWPVLPTADRVYVGTLGAGLDVLNLEEARTYDVRVRFPGPPALEDGVSVIRWDANGLLGWPSTARVETRTRVDGGAWTRWSTERSRRLENLGSGRHRFAVEARNWLGDDVARAEMRFTVPPPLLFRPVVLGPLAALLLSSIWLSVVQVVRRRRYEAERSAAEVQRRRLAAAVEQANDGIAITDPAGVVEFVNPAFESLTGWMASEVLGNPIRDLPGGSTDAGHYRAAMDVVERGEAWDGEAPVARKDGGSFRALQRITPLRDPSGRITSFVWLLRDITQEAELEAQVRQVQKLEAVGQLTAGIAHDFNNLLAVVIANTSLLADDIPEDNPDARQSLDDIVVAAQRGAKLVNDLIAFGRRRRLVIESVDIGALLQDVELALRLLLPSGIRVQLRVDDGVPAVRADAEAVRQVLIDLATNARDAMPDGGTLTVAVSPAEQGEPAEVAAGPVWARPHVCITVTDTGCGMDSRVLARAFEPFFSTKPPNAGDGLGLSRAYGTVHQLGGEIELESALGVGTTVRVRLPSVSAGELDAPLSPVVRSDEGGPPTVLVVEDAPQMRRAAELVLSRLGYRVFSAANGEEALAVFRAHPEEIGLVLADVVMPRLDGPGLYEALGIEGKRPPFIFMSGHPESDLARRRLADPTLPLLVKPWTAEELARAVHQAIAPAEHRPPR